MAYTDFFGTPIAYNPDTNELLGDALFTVHAIDDVGLSTPLLVTDPVSGAPINPLQSSPIGVLPSFRAPGDPAQVILKSGPFTTRITSVYGAAQEAVVEALDDELTAHPAWPWAITLGSYTPPPVDNHAPTVVIDTNATVITGRDATLVWTASDPDNDPVVSTVDWGDGTVGAATSPALHTYAADGTYDVVITASDGSATGTATHEFVAVDGGGTPVTAYHDAMVALTPVLYLPLGDTAPPPAPAVGVATITSDTWPTFGVTLGIGDAEKCAEFSTSVQGQRIDLGRPTSMDAMSAWSFVALVRPASNSGGQDITARDDRAQNSTRLFTFQRTSGAFALTRYQPASSSFSTPANYPANFIYLVAVTVDASSTKIYVNRALSASDPITTPITAVNAAWALGRRKVGDSAPSFMGSMAGAAYFNRTLTLAEITTLADAAGIPA